MSPIKENLLSITELAKLRQVTSETLRYYDRIGLITPDYVDPQTRYRYYSIRQYEKLGTIKELRQLGMSIHDITDYFSGRNLRKSHQLLLHQLELLEEINAMGIGPQGFGGKTTCLGLAIEQMPTHVAGLPVAVNVSCHVTRRASAVL